MKEMLENQKRRSSTADGILFTVNINILKTNGFKYII